MTGKTIREDLAKLEEKGLLLRIHGGAMLAQSDQLGILSQKEPIIKHAPTKNGDRDARPPTTSSQATSSHWMAAAQRLKLLRGWTNQPLTVVTNDVYIIGELARKDEIRLVVPGGYRVRNMLAGAEAGSLYQDA